MGMTVDQAWYDEPLLAINDRFVGEFGRQVVRMPGPSDGIALPHDGGVTDQACITLRVPGWAGRELSDVLQDGHQVIGPI
jgi:hypothetical protein